MIAGSTLFPPLLLALDGATIKLLFFVAFVLIGGLGKLLEEIAKATARRREAEKVAERESATYTSTTREEPRAPMNQAELEERLRKMLGRDPPPQNRASTPPSTSRPQRSIAPASTPVVTTSKRARKEASRKAALARAAELGAQEARLAESIARVRSLRRAKARRDPGAPIRAMLRGGNTSVRQAFLLSEILNRKY